MKKLINSLRTWAISFFDLTGADCYNISLSKTEIENISNSYLTQCFNNKTFGNLKAPEYINYLGSIKYLKNELQ